MQIVFVVVLHGVDITASSSLSSLDKAIDSLRLDGVLVLIVDNSQHQEYFEKLNNRTYYFSFGDNTGLAKAYNLALRYCIDLSATHLVTMDQDSVVSEDYLKALSNAIQQDTSNSYAAFVPVVTSHERIISPFYFNLLGWPSYGIQPHKKLYAINSFVVFNVKTMVEFGGFDEHYWLDALDLSTFSRIHAKGGIVQGLNTKVEHQLSLLGGQVGLHRASSIFFYESCYLFEYKKGIAILTGITRLFVRALMLASKRGSLFYFYQCIRSAFKGARAGGVRRNSVKVIR